MGVPFNDEARRRAEGPREALKIGIGLGAGLIPAAFAIPFVTTLCPAGTLVCSVPSDGIHFALFTGACVSYLLQVVATVVCSIWRATRPIALGLLIMLVLGPLIAGVAITSIFQLKNPSADAAALLLLLPSRGGVVAKRRLLHSERHHAHTSRRVRADVVAAEGRRPRRLFQRARRSMASSTEAASALTIASCCTAAT